MFALNQTDLAEMGCRLWAGNASLSRAFWVLMMSALVLVFTCVYISQGSYIAQQEARIRELEDEYAQKLGR